MLLKKIKITPAKIKFIRHLIEKINFCRDRCKYYDSPGCLGAKFCGRYIMYKEKKTSIKDLRYYYTIEQ